jgi:hypothetical protein
MPAGKKLKQRQMDSHCRRQDSAREYHDTWLPEKGLKHKYSSSQAGSALAQ